ATKRDLATIGETAIKVRQAGERMLQLFPTGSETGAAEAKSNVRERWDRFQAKTRNLVQAAEAKSNVRERWDRFQAKTRNLVQAAGALENIAASEDPRAISVRYVAVRRACGECHILFRYQK